jgi:hypothetical protein
MGAGRQDSTEVVDSCISITRDALPMASLVTDSLFTAIIPFTAIIDRGKPSTALCDEMWVCQHVRGLERNKETKASGTDCIDLKHLARETSEFTKCPL